MFHGIGVTAVLAAAILAGCRINTSGDAFKAKYTRNEDLTAALAGIATLDVSTNVGRIEVTAADVAEAQISAVIKVKAKTEEKAQELGEGVRIEAEPSGRTLLIRAIKPSGFGRNELSVNFTITVPASLGIKAETNVGDIRVAGSAGRMEGRTNVGTIACTGLRSDADLHTNVGDVRAEYASDAPAAISVDASADVGNVELAGPKDISARLAAEANVGSISSDRPLTVSGSLKQSIKASLGNGEGRIHLRTNVGSIRIR
jgi:DUF4097 and DUF4098 domain-containing protein YvlB